MFYGMGCIFWGGVADREMCFQAMSMGDKGLFDFQSLSLTNLSSL